MLSEEKRPPFPVTIFLVLPDITLALVLALGLPKPTRIIFFLVFALLSYKGLQYTTGDKMQDYSMGSTIGGQFLTALHLLLIVEPIRQYRHAKDVDDPRTRPLLKRMYWTGCIIHSPRGIGWNYETPYVLERPTMTSRNFVYLRILRAIGWFFIMDAAQTFIHTNPYFSGSPMEAESALISSQGLPYRFLNIVAWMLTPYAGIRLQYYLISAISVMLGLSMPVDWPAPFGRWSEAYTVRRFWGRTWHQLLRRNVSSMGKAVVQVVGFKKGTWLSSYTQLFVGFFVSGVMHCFGDAMVGRQYLGSSFPFFIVQVVAIVAEDIVIGLAGRLRIHLSSRISHVIGFIWVFSWSMISFPLYIDWAVKAGLGKSEPLPVSPIRFLLGWK